MAYFDVCRRIRLRDHSLQMKATKQDFVMVLFTVLYKVAHTFQSVDERKSSRLKWDHSNETYWAILSNTILFIIVYKEVLTFESGWNPRVKPTYNIKLLTVKAQK